MGWTKEQQEAVKRNRNRIAHNRCIEMLNELFGWDFKARELEPIPEGKTSERRE